MRKTKQAVILLLLLLNFACASKAEPNQLAAPAQSATPAIPHIAFLIPKGYTGGVVILFNQPDGIMPVTGENGTTLYPIPKDGYLKVRNMPAGGAYQHKFYYVDRKYNRIPLIYVSPQNDFIDPKDMTEKKISALSEDEQKKGTFVMNLRTLTFKINEQPELMFAFSVGQLKDAGRFYTETDFRVGRIQEELQKIRLNSVQK